MVQSALYVQYEWIKIIDVLLIFFQKSISANTELICTRMCFETVQQSVILFCCLTKKIEEKKNCISCTAN